MPRARTATPPAPGAGTVTLRGVELVRVGTWAASTGVTTITGEDLASMLAAYADPEVDAAAIRIGHVDPRFDGQPALGWVENLRLGEDGRTLLGDLVDVPAGLEEVIPRAFRRRSVEIAWGVRTPAGRRYRAALSGLALLGVQAPAVKNLADIVNLYRTPERTAAAGELEAAETVTLELGPLEPLEVAALAARARADIAAGRPERAELALAALAAGVEGSTTPTPSGANNDPAGNPTPNGGQPMPLDEARIRELIGAAEDDDLEARLTDLRARAETPAPGTDPANPTPAPGTDPATPTPDPTNPNPAPTPTGPANPGDPDPNATPADGRVPATVGGGAPGTPAAGEVVALSKGAYDELVSRAGQGAEAWADLRARQVDEAITSALSTGRIVPADEPGWRADLEDPAKFDWARTRLSSLTPVITTTGHELGDATGSDFSSGEAVAQVDATLSSMFGDEYVVAPTAGGR